MKLAEPLDVLHSKEAIQTRVRELGAQITRDYQSHGNQSHGNQGQGSQGQGSQGQSKDLVLVTVLKGAILFAADLCREIDLPLSLDFIGLSSYGEATESSGVVKITSDLTKPIEGKHVLVIEDIIDTGLTMRYLLDNLATRHPASVKICSLLHKPARARTKIPIEYLGFTIPDLFVVGYGLDAAEKFRNVPFIGVVRAHPKTE